MKNWGKKGMETVMAEQVEAAAKKRDRKIWLRIWLVVLGILALYVGWQVFTHSTPYKAWQSRKDFKEAIGYVTRDNYDYTVIYHHGKSETGFGDIRYTDEPDLVVKTFEDIAYLRYWNSEKDPLETEGTTLHDINFEPLRGHNVMFTYSSAFPEDVLIMQSAHCYVQCPALYDYMKNLMDETTGKDAFRPYMIQYVDLLTESLLTFTLSDPLQ